MVRAIRGVVFSTFLMLLMTMDVAGQSGDTITIRKIMAQCQQLRENFPDSSFALAEKGILLAEEANDYIGLVDLLISKGAIYWMKNDYLPAIENYGEALSISREHHWKKGVYRAEMNLGQVHSKLGDYPRAIEYFLKSIALGDSIHSDNSLAFNSLAVAYRKSNNLDQAIAALQESIRIASSSKATGQPGLRGGVYANLGNIYMNKGDLDKAMFYHRKALAIFDSLHQDRGIVTCYNNIAEVLALQGNNKEALDWSSRSLKLSHHSKLFSNEASALEGMATIASKTGNPTLAVNYLGQAIVLSEAHQHKTELIRLYQAMAYNYEKIGRESLALQYLKKHISAKDSVFNQEANNKIANVRVGFEVNKREIDKRIFEQERKIAILNRNILIGLVTALLLIATVITFSQFLRIKKNELLLQQMEVIHDTQQKLLQQELENEKLKQQELQREIEKNSRELTTHALNLLQKNEMLEEIKEGLVDIHSDLHPEARREIQKLVSSINLSHHQDKEWLGFKAHFEKIHVGFFEKLQQDYPDLSGNDIKICSLVKLNLGVKETASILGISTDSVKTARYRLRKKLKLEQAQNLLSFLAGYD